MRRITVSLIALALTASSLAAQKKANTRTGFWIGFGGGSGSATFDCSSCDADPVSGASGNLRMGGTLNQRWLLGGEVNTWLHSETGVDETIVFASFVAQFYPSATGAFYLKFGIGGMSYLAADGTDEITATGSSAILGLGYDFRLGTNFSLSPYLNSMAAANVKMKFNGQPFATPETLTLTLVQIGLSLNWH